MHAYCCVVIVHDLRTFSVESIRWNYLFIYFFLRLAYCLFLHIHSSLVWKLEFHAILMSVLILHISTCNRLWTILMHQSCIIVRFMYDIKQNSFIHVKLECFESSSGRWFIFKNSGLQSSLQNRMRTFIVHYYVQIVFIYVFSNGRRMEYTFTKQKI